VGVTPELATLVDFASDLKKLSPSVVGRIYITEGLVREGIPQLFAQHQAAQNAVKV
jgi:hypothetical protein